MTKKATEKSSRFHHCRPLPGDLQLFCPSHTVFMHAHWSRQHVGGQDPASASPAEEQEMGTMTLGVAFEGFISCSSAESKYLADYFKDALRLMIFYVFRT